MNPFFFFLSCCMLPLQVETEFHSNGMVVNARFCIDFVALVLNVAVDKTKGRWMRRCTHSGRYRYENQAVKFKTVVFLLKHLTMYSFCRAFPVLYAWRGRQNTISWKRKDKFEGENEMMHRGRTTRGGQIRGDLDRFVLFLFGQGDKKKKTTTKSSSWEFSLPIGVLVKSSKVPLETRGAVKILTLLCDAFKHL